MLTVRGLGTGGSLSCVGKEDTVRQLPRIREGAGRGATHTEGIDKGGEPIGLRTPASNEKLGGLWKASQARKDP